MRENDIKRALELVITAMYPNPINSEGARFCIKQAVEAAFSLYQNLLKHSA